MLHATHVVTLVFFATGCHWSLHVAPLNTLAPWNVSDAVDRSSELTETNDACISFAICMIWKHKLPNQCGTAQFIPTWWRITNWGNTVLAARLVGRAGWRERMVSERYGSTFNYFWSIWWLSRGIKPNRYRGSVSSAVRWFRRWRRSDSTKE